MKIKIDFVPNSSSSSFVAMGVYFDLADLSDEQIKMCRKEFEEYGFEFGREHIYKYRCEIPDVLLAGSDLRYSCGPDYDETQIMVGIPYTDMKTFETLSEFKSRAKLQLKSKLNIDVDPHHIEACWIDN